MWAISGLLGTTLGTIRRGTVKVWHEKAQRLRSSVYLGLHVPTARQRAERQVQVTLAGSLCFTMSSPAIMSAGGQVPRGTGVMCTSQGLVSTLHYGPLYRLNRNMCTKRSGPFTRTTSPLVSVRRGCDRAQGQIARDTPRGVNPVSCDRAVWSSDYGHAYCTSP